ncbi:MAG TPA: hypothetical protein VIY28_17840 [Pseudonocardiaceae bacterium]
MPGICGAGGVRSAPPGLTRVLLRIAVLGALVVAGWLLGAGIGLAQDEPPDSASNGLLAAVPTARSAVQGLLSGAPLPLAPPTHLVLSPAQRTAATPSRVVGHQRAATPAVRAVAATPPTPTAPAATPPAAVARPDNPAATTSHPATYRFAGPSVLGHGSAPPAPASPLATTCVVGSTGCGASTKGASSVTLDDQRATADLATTQSRLGTGAGGTPRWLAEQPSTSPD